MRKYITLFSVIALFFVGMQNSVAQEQKQSPEAIAKKKTHDLHEEVTLTGDQQRQIFNLLVDAETNIAAIDAKNLNLESAQKAKAAIIENTNTRIKAILNPEQFTTFMARSTEKVEKKK